MNTTIEPLPPEYVNTAAGLLTELKETADWRELLSVLATTFEPVDEALANGNHLYGAIFTSFLYGALDGLLAVELPPDSRGAFLEKLESNVRDTLESWCIELPGNNEPGDQRV